MNIHSFLDKDTETFTHVLVDTASKHCAIIDPVLDLTPQPAKLAMTMPITSLGLSNHKG